MAKRYTEEEVQRLLRDGTVIKQIELDRAKATMERVLRCWITDTGGLNPRHERVFHEACCYTRDAVCRPVLRLSSAELRKWRRRIQRSSVEIPDKNYLLSAIEVELAKRKEQGLR